VGQKVQLYPTSESDFFVKQFYGEVSFHRDERGEVERLDFVMRVPNTDPSEPLRAMRIN